MVHFDQAIRIRLAVDQQTEELVAMVNPSRKNQTPEAEILSANLLTFVVEYSVDIIELVATQRKMEKQDSSSRASSLNKMYNFMKNNQIQPCILP